MKIPITFLGTGAVVPTATRNHLSILLSYKSNNILIDCGEGTQRQLRKAKISPCKITHLLITHWHGDHILGLPGLFQTLALNDYNKTLQIYGPKGTKKFIKELFRIFIPIKKIKVKVYEVKGEFLKTSDFKLIAFPLKHGPPCNGYIFKEKDKLRINKSKLRKLRIAHKDKQKLSQLIKGKTIKLNKKTIKPNQITYLQKGKKISFIFDTKPCNNAARFAKDSDLAIIESTYTNKEKELEKQYNHLTAAQAAEIAKKAKVKKLILTHFSQRHEHKSNIFLKQAKKIFKKTAISNDFDKVEV